MKKLVELSDALAPLGAESSLSDPDELFVSYEMCDERQFHVLAYPDGTVHLWHEREHLHLTPDVLALLNVIRSWQSATSFENAGVD